MSVVATTFTDLFSDPRVDVAGALLTPFVAYKAWQILSTDRRRNRQDDNADKFYGDLQAQHAKAVEKADQATALASSVALEKQQLQLESEMLKQRIKELAQRLADTDTQTAHLRSLLSVVQQYNAQLQARVEAFTLLRREQGLPDLPPIAVPIFDQSNLSTPPREEALTSTSAA